ncbi:sensor domain-containing protein [Streptomyces iconiensis]|uniref:Sensor domain-containing protein n=1 Tax=Streptomyces iconiensis TaxID=1384038 RepID=A0ABT7A826_9ACTN|nr:sensor domain-containing protein [Streptomyces iconiensis]MDJ1137492.1 sensor domain-containing protein [Streptomyces iconiensis]
MTTTQARMQPGAYGAPVRTTGRLGREMGYLLSGLPLGIAGFVCAVTGFALGVGTLVIVLGLPVLAGALSVARYFARVEAEQIAYTTGRPLPPLKEHAAAGRWSALRDPQAWRDLLHAVVGFPVRIAAFAVALVWMAGGLGGLTYGLWSWSVPRDGHDGLIDVAFGVSGTGPDIALNTAFGVVLLATTVPVVRGLTAMRVGLARVLLRDGAL